MYLENFTGTIVQDNGIVCRYKNSKLHCLEGPAISDPDHYEEWYVEGLRHRMNGPAYINFLTKEKEFWIQGQKYSEESFKKKTSYKDDPYQIRYEGGEVIDYCIYFNNEKIATISEHDVTNASKWADKILELLNNSVDKL